LLIAWKTIFSHEITEAKEPGGGCDERSEHGTRRRGHFDPAADDPDRQPVLPLGSGQQSQRRPDQAFQEGIRPFGLAVRPCSDSFLFWLFLLRDPRRFVHEALWL
jgi:hypothetical protein